MTNSTGRERGEASRGIMLRRTVLGLLGVVAAVSAMLIVPAPGLAQGGPPPPPAAPEIRQVRLSDQQVVGFLGAQKDLIAITTKLEEAGDTIDEKLQRELDDIGRKHGFRNFSDFEEIRANVMMVLAGIDPDTNEYSDPIELIRKDIEAIKADKTITEEDRKAQLEEMQDALREMQPLKFKENIEVVKKFAKQIDDVLKDR